MGSWARAGRVPGFLQSGGGNVCPSDANDSVKELWFGDGVAISSTIFGCVLSLEGSKVGRDFTSNADSLAHISIILSYERLGFFRAHDMSFKDRLFEG